ncbi:MAG TPA: DNA repair protein RadC [Nevskiaceae bacterium]|nr:DNA repair protein RadC [Nevskiaceae bacterium]
MTLRDWPEADRPREKLLARGPGALSDAELLAIFLRTGVAGQTAVDLARSLLTRFGSLRGLLAAEREAFCAARGLGVAKYAQLQAVLEMARRHLGEQLTRGSVLDHPQAVRDYLVAQLRHRPREAVLGLFLDAQNQLLACETLAEGSLTQATVHAREVVSRALALGAASLILAHNHPSGQAEPSAADRALTDRLRQALALVEVRLLDHFVIGEGPPTSFAERGWL